MSHAFHFKEPCQFATVEKIAAKHLQSLLKVFILVIPGQIGPQKFLSNFTLYSVSIYLFSFEIVGLRIRRLSQCVDFTVEETWPYF